MYYPYAYWVGGNGFVSKYSIGYWVGIIVDPNAYINNIMNWKLHRHCVWLISALHSAMTSYRYLHELDLLICLYISPYSEKLNFGRFALRTSSSVSRSRKDVIQSIVLKILITLPISSCLIVLLLLARFPLNLNIFVSSSILFSLYMAERINSLVS